MADVFISYVEEDSEVAIALSEGLETAGYSTWCYERHSVPGPSYLAQTREAIGESRVFVIVLSKDSLKSFQIEKEVVRAHETGKRFLPVLRGITHAEFQVRQPEWAQAAGGATGVHLPQGSIAEVLPRIVRGLRMMRIEPGGAKSTEPVVMMPPSSIATDVRPPDSVDQTAPAGVIANESPLGTAFEKAIPPRDRDNSSRRLIVAGVAVAVLGVSGFGVTYWATSGAPHRATQQAPTLRDSSPTVDADNLRRLATNFAGVKPGETIQQFTARFGEPKRQSATGYGSTRYYFDTPDEFFVAVRDDNPRITLLSVSRGGAQKLRLRGVNDPLLGFIGQARDQLLGALGSPSVTSPDGKIESYYFPDVRVDFQLDDRRTCYEIWIYFRFETQLGLGAGPPRHRASATTPTSSPADSSASAELPRLAS